MESVMKFTFQRKSNFFSLFSRVSVDYLGRRELRSILFVEGNAGYEARKETESDTENTDKLE